MLLAFCLASCQRGQNESACTELNHYVPPGVSLADNEERCTELLDFSRVVSQTYEMDFSTWLTKVAGQRMTLMTETVFALPGLGAWSPASFGQLPAEVPCGKGVPVTDALWTGSPLSQILSARPEYLYVSLAVDIAASADTATVRVIQDFNCDHKPGVMQVVGRFKTGVPAPNGGWEVISTSVPPLDN